MELEVDSNSEISRLDNIKAEAEIVFELQQFQQAAKWSRLLEIVLISLVGWVPKPLGTLLRRGVYRSILGQVGRSLSIHGTGVELAGAKWIGFGDSVTVQRDVSLHAFVPRSQIYVDDGAYLNRGVDIRVCPHEGDARIEIGKNTVVGPYTCIHGPGQIKIGDSCLIASHVNIYANNHVFADPTRNIADQGLTYEGIVIEDDCWLGAGVKVLDGVKIGKGCVIGAGAVVTKDIPPYSIAVGVPAKVISSRTLKE